MKATIETPSAKSHNSKASDVSDYQYHGRLLSFVERTSLAARKLMLGKLMRLVEPGPETTVLDIGVTSDNRVDSNFFEALYAYPSQLTALGLEDASFLEQRHPGVKFVQADALDLPFAQQSFDLVVSFAVIEHVGSQARQRRFVEEACRVGKRVFITTPNRFHPIEFHTLTPFLHWLPPEVFRTYLRCIGQRFFALEENLNLLSEDQLRGFVPHGFTAKIERHKFLGFTSNFLMLIERSNSSACADCN